MPVESEQSRVVQGACVISVTTWIFSPIYKLETFLCNGYYYKGVKLNKCVIIGLRKDLMRPIRIWYLMGILCGPKCTYFSIDPFWVHPVQRSRLSCPCTAEEEGGDPLWRNVSLLQHSLFNSLADQSGQSSIMVYMFNHWLSKYYVNDFNWDTFPQKVNVKYILNFPLWDIFKFSLYGKFLWSNRIHMSCPLLVVLWL